MTEKRPSTRNPTTWFYGWLMVAISGLMSTLFSGFVARGSSIWLLPVQEYFGLSRGAVSVAFSVARSEGAFEGPAIGWLLDRFGARTVIFWTSLLMGVGMLILPLASKGTPTTFWLFFFPLWLGAISFGGYAAFSHGCHVLVANWFIRQRAFALAVFNGIKSSGGALVILLLSWIILTHGWRPAAVVAGLSTLIVALPLTFFLIRRSPESKGLYPDGSPPAEGVALGQRRAEGLHGPSRVVREVDFQIKEALLTRSFWFLLVGNLFRNIARGVVFVHFVAIVEWRGGERQTAAFILGLSFFVEIFMLLLMGWLADRSPKSLVLSVGMVCGALATVMLFPGMPLWTLFVFAILFAAMNGQGPAVWATVGDYFGRTNFGAIRGIIGFASTPGVLAAPMLAGFWFDSSQSYTVPLAVVVGLFGFSAAIFMFLRKAEQPLRPPSIPRRF